MFYLPKMSTFAEICRLRGQNSSAAAPVSKLIYEYRFPSVSVPISRRRERKMLMQAQTSRRHRAQQEDGRPRSVC